MDSEWIFLRIPSIFLMETRKSKTSLISGPARTPRQPQASQTGRGIGLHTVWSASGLFWDCSDHIGRGASRLGMRIPESVEPV